MTYWQYAYPSSPGHPYGAVHTPPLSSYYSPRVAPYSQPRMGQEDYGYPVSPDARYQYEYVPAYEDIDRRRAQRHAYTETRRSPRQASPQQQPQQPPAAGHRQATAQDRAEAGIPAGYSTKNWDPAEEPIFLLGSVFDANSLGKWIYDWTVYRHGPGTEELELAGELWLSLIALSGKIRQAEDLLLRREKGSKRRLIEDFLDDGDELFDRFRRLLKSCERSMMRVAKRDRETGRVSMGASSGCEFVDCIFGESRGLQETEDLIQSMINWDKRYDATFRKSRKRRTAY